MKLDNLKLNLWEYLGCDTFWSTITETMEFCIRFSSGLLCCKSALVQVETNARKSLAYLKLQVCDHSCQLVL